MTASVIAALALVRLLLMPWVVLVPEEAYYWMYAKHPAPGYLDHPPMVAWCIILGTRLLGDTELGVRLGTWLLNLGSTWLCYRLAADWCGRRAGWTAALLFSLAPLLFSSGFLAMPDAPLIFFWLLALLAVGRAYRHGATRWWVLAGAASGAAFLAKYPAAFLALGTFLFLLSDARGRALLLRPGVWIGLGVAVLVAAPVLWWNAQHDWASFRFQFARRAGQHGDLHLLQAARSLGLQCLVLSPLLFALMCASLALGVRRWTRDAVGRWRFALCFSVPWLAACVYHGLFAEIRMNWPIPAYLSLLPLAAVVWRARALPGLRRRGPDTARRLWVGHTGTVLAANAILVLVVLGWVPFVPTPRPLLPWDRLGEAAEAAEDAFAVEIGREPFILADGRYNLASELAFYMQEAGADDDWRDVMPLTTAVGGGLNYVHWRDPDEFLGRSAIFITGGARPAQLAALRRVFAAVDPPQLLLELPRSASKHERFWVVRCHTLRAVPSAGLAAGTAS